MKQLKQLICSIEELNKYVKQACEKAGLSFEDFNIYNLPIGEVYDKIKLHEVILYKGYYNFEDFQHIGQLREIHEADGKSEEEIHKEILKYEEEKIIQDVLVLENEQNDLFNDFEILHITPEEYEKLYKLINFISSFYIENGIETLYVNDLIKVLMYEELQEELKINNTKERKIIKI